MGVFKRTASTSIIATALTAGAIVRYPGGTLHDRSRVGYSFTRNFLSDLGMTVSYSGASNRLGAALFTASLFVLVAGLGWTLATIVRLLARERAARGWASLGAILGLFACAAFAGVAVTPENRVMAIHVAFTIWGWTIVSLVAVHMTLASFQSTRFHRRASVAWLVITALLALYAWLLRWGPDLATPSGFKAQVIAQKVAACVVVLGLMYVAREADRAESVPPRQGRSLHSGLS